MKTGFARKVSIVVIVGVMFMLATLAALADDPGYQTASEYFGANPELATARRYASTASSLAHFAANPESAVAGHPSVYGARSSFYAANPELMAARRYSADFARSGSDAWTAEAGE